MPLAVWAGIIGGTLGVLVVLLAAPADLFGRVPPLTGHIHAAPTQVAVVDGETLVLNETIIRLDGIAAPARGQVCHGAQGAQTDCGAEAAAALAAFVRGRDVSCRLNGRDREGFPRAVCEAAGQELNRALVTAGWARARIDMPGLAPEEAAARAAGRGLWRAGWL
jgi:endonuclease YncB( thermonuclease family)